jgi:pyroglutamyl-peptidase
LLNELLNQNGLPPNARMLRKLPVDFQRAPELVIAAIQEYSPEVVICCGMAERRSRLTVESNGKLGGETLKTGINLQVLVSNLKRTAISHDAGRFVCNHLYYSVLDYLRQYRSNSRCVFVHVPLLEPDNCTEILADFRLIVQRMQISPSTPLPSSPASDRHQAAAAYIAGILRVEVDEHCDREPAAVNPSRLLPTSTGDHPGIDWQGIAHWD